jgi:CheY-like chemotaxis protein
MDLKGSKILIGDDIPANLNILRDVLEPQGYKIMVATNGATALEIAERSDPDLILLDVMMPEMSGFEVCRKLKKNDKLKDIPVIFITAKDGVDNLMEGFASGGVDYIRKPFQIEEVRVRVKNHLKLAKLLREEIITNSRLKQEISLREKMELDQRRLMDEKRKASEAASRLEATETLAGGLAHDFNNLITVILGNVSLIRTLFSESHKCFSMLSAIENASEQAADLTRQMLAYARGGKYQPELIELKKVLNEVIRLKQWNVPENIEFKLQCDEVWRIEADITQIQQILIALLSNSIEAIGPINKGKILVTAENIENPTASEEDVKVLEMLDPGSYVKIRIQDNGAGMDEETRSRVFEPFFSTKFQGRGMGLAAVYGIVKNHGGHIVANDISVQGAMFTIYLPAIQNVLNPAIEDNVKYPSGSEDLVTVMLVDDDEPVISIIQQLLNQHGYTTLTASNGQEAVDLAKSYTGKIDLVLLDMAMPVMGGEEAYPLLKSARPDLKVIICSGYELDEKMKKTLKNGADAFIQKPFHFEKMISEIEKILYPASTQR